jgi:hypothetical protein
LSYSTPLHRATRNNPSRSEYKPERQKQLKKKQGNQPDSLSHPVSLTTSSVEVFMACEESVQRHDRRKLLSALAGRRVVQVCCKTVKRREPSERTDEMKRTKLEVLQCNLSFVLPLDIHTLLVPGAIACSQTVWKDGLCYSFCSSDIFGSYSEPGGERP